jgi:UDP-glucose 4-epimerase
MDIAVTGTTRDPARARREGVDWFVGDLGDPAFARRALAHARPDVVFHLAGAVTGSRDAAMVLPTYHGLLTTTVNLLTACREWGDPVIVVAGSLEDPGPGATAPPASPYAAAKEAARRYVEMFHTLYAMRVATARIFMVYGPGEQDERRLVPYIVRSLLAGRSPALSSGSRPVDWICVDDVVTGLIAVASSPGALGRTLDLGSGVTHTVREVGEQLSALIGGGVSLGWGEVPDRPFERVAVANVRPTQKICGWEPAILLEEGLARTVAWMLDRS